MEKKSRSIFGLIVAILVALEVMMMYSKMTNLVTSQSSGAAMLGAAFGVSLIRPFLTCAVISAVAALIAFFARWKLGYIVGAVLMIVGILLLPAFVGVPTEPAILAILLVVAFFVDSSKQKKQAREQAEAERKAAESYTAEACAAYEQENKPTIQSAKLLEVLNANPDPESLRKKLYLLASSGSLTQEESAVIQEMMNLPLNDILAALRARIGA